MHHCLPQNLELQKKSRLICDKFSIFAWTIVYIASSPPPSPFSLRQTHIPCRDNRTVMEDFDMSKYADKQTRHTITIKIKDDMNVFLFTVNIPVFFYDLPTDIFPKWENNTLSFPQLEMCVFPKWIPFPLKICMRSCNLKIFAWNRASSQCKKWIWITVLNWTELNILKQFLNI